ncbi:MAG: AmmeMemoRadiSam system protein A [Planctomycetes bacterium]|nr:AmmeMemoRadiSam system protein A [Planctomycetota bacterium]MBU1517669.1 AmmeMemoRadiSam system protein A [Planctomycetota bacterium]MBU2458707.1 AmmeMemoRadiSam system protein A [Planctomycetota bacterium]MBU2596148.1 AmmeMemoRadiSam system protein A [Planctomycetota bacterium]
MTENQKKQLLTIAKNAAAAAAAGKKPPKALSSEAELNAHCGCFVTLKNRGELRGCIGQFISEAPLIELVSEMAVAATTGDARFFADRITPQEVKELDIGISVLSPLKKTADPLSLRLGVDGIYIKRDYASGCFLPQVATETGWSKEEFLSYCCEHKAGLKPDAWKDKDTEVYLFTADIIEEGK